jgi:ATP-dependent Clp protease adaptor protein ClpS
MTETYKSCKVFSNNDTIFAFHMETQRNIETLTLDEVDVLEDDTFSFQLIVWNDDINSFEWVIKTLVDVCKHEIEQAEQCTMLIHFKGKCSVKSGPYDDLKLMCDGITDRGIGATVEELVS